MDQQANYTVDLTVSDLEQVRREIDDLDDGLLALLQQRFDVIARVKMAKKQAGTAGKLPLRPAREAMILRRLTENNNSRVPNDLVLTLWRNIICRSTLAQATVQINAASDLLNDKAARIALSRHFVGFPLKPYNKVKMALNSAAKSHLEICAIAAETKWINHLEGKEYADLKVILTLPYDGKNGKRHIVILGKLLNEPTGDDETMLVSNGSLPRDFVPAPLWEVKTASGHTLTSLPGYLTTSEGPLVGLNNGNSDLALKVLGRYPSPFEV